VDPGLHFWEIVIFFYGRHQGIEASSRGKTGRVIHRLRRLDADYLRGFLREEEKGRKTTADYADYADRRKRIGRGGGSALGGLF